MLDAEGGAGARAEDRLRGEEVAWLTTVRPDGQPQSVPVWFLWDGEAFLVYSRPGARKLRNIEANPKRSEEHTSELQSRQYLVCRLLLEKKKKIKDSAR